MITDSTPLPAGFKQWIRDPRVAISAGFLLLFYFTVKVFEAGPPPIYPWLNLYPQTALLLICMVMVGFAWFFQGKDWLVHLLAHLFAYGFATATVLIWQGLEFGPQGISGDSWFTTAMITKFKAYGGSQDFVYKGLHSYYPSLFHLI